MGVAVTLSSVVADQVHGALGVVDRMQPWFLTRVRAIIGTGLHDMWVLLVYLKENPPVAATIAADAESQDWQKFTTDVEAAWAAANP
jgi:hypothetical protein